MFRKRRPAKEKRRQANSETEAEKRDRDAMAARVVKLWDDEGLSWEDIAARTGLAAASGSRLHDRMAGDPPGTHGLNLVHALYARGKRNRGEEE